MATPGPPDAGVGGRGEAQPEPPRAPDGAPDRDADREPDRGAGPRRSPVSAGDLLAGRYRLARPLPGAAGGSAVLWKAVDEVLARPVAVTVLAARTRTGVARPFLEAAARTGPVLAPGLARTYDAAFEERPGRDGEPRIVAAYVISEWVEGRSLDEVLRDGPLPPAEAIALVEQAAEALSAVHQAGLVHGRVTPGNLLLGDDGRLRITGTALAAVTHGETPPEGEAGVLADTRGLAEVLYALLTGRWPGDPARSGGLPAAPAREGRSLSPRQVRAGVPRALDLVVAACLWPSRVPAVPSAVTPRQLADAARATVVERVEAVRVPLRQRLPAVPRPVRRAVPYVATLVLLLLVGITGYSLGSDLGRLETEEDPLEALVSTTAAPSPGRTSLVLDLSRATVRSYDPSGDGAEQAGEVPNAVDGDLGTAWRTDRYRTPRFGGLKPGVGLLVDLGTPTEVGRVEVDAGAAGTAFEVRAGNALGEDADALVVVGRGSGERARIDVRAGAKGRYWLLWLTQVPRDGAGFRGAVEELRLVRRG